jgi:hypothetical protein
MLLPNLARLSLAVGADGGEQRNPYDQRGLQTWSEAERRADTMERLQRRLRIGEISQAEYDERMARDAQAQRERDFERDYEAFREMEEQRMRARRAARERRARDDEMRTWRRYQGPYTPQPAPPQDDYDQGLPDIRPPDYDYYDYYDDPQPQPYEGPQSPLYSESQPENQLGLYRDESREQDGTQPAEADATQPAEEPEPEQEELMSEQALMARWAQTRRKPWSP